MAKAAKKASATSARQKAETIGVQATAPAVSGAPKAAPQSIADRLRAHAAPSNASAGPAKSTIEGEEVEQAISDYVQALSDKKDAEAAMADAAAVIIPEAEKQRLALCRKSKVYTSSVKLNNRLLYTYNPQFCKVKITKEANDEGSQKVEGLRQTFGAKFDEYFEVGNSVSVQDGALNDELLDALFALCEKMGKSFGDIFGVEQVLVCKKIVIGKDKKLAKLVNDYSMDPATEKLLQAAKDKGDIKPFQPTLRE